MCRNSWNLTLQRSIWVAAFLTMVTATPSLSARSDDVESYIRSADQLLQKGDLRGAQIQLRNAIQKAPEDGELRLKLGQVYLRLDDPVAAEATAIAARERGVPEDRLAPLLAEALYREAEYGRLLKAVPTGDRPASVESIVRTFRGLAHLALGENGDAETMLRDAARLDPGADGPRVALAYWFLRAGKLDEAESQADAVLATSAENEQALVAKGAVLVGRGEMVAALDNLNAALDRRPTDIQARILRINVRVEQGDLDSAQKDLDFVLERAPQLLQANYLQVLVYAKRGNFKAADDTLTKKMGSSFGPIVEAYYLAGVVKYQLNQLDQAEDYLARYVARQPGSFRAYLILGSTALRKGDPKHAIDNLQTAMKLAPTDVEVLSLLGQAYMAHGETEKALEVLESAAKQRPDNPALQAELAVTRIDRGETTIGLGELEHILRSDPKGAAVGPALVLSALRVGEIDRAVAAAEDLVKRDPDNTVYRELLGMARFANRDLPGAEQTFRDLLNKNPDIAPARRNLAQVYFAMGRNDDAKRLFDDALKNNPNDVDSLMMRADIGVREGTVQDAVKYLKRAQDASSNDPAPGLRLVLLYESQKNWDAALTAALDLRTNFQQSVDVAEALARVQMEAGDPSSALMTYQRAVDLAPQSVAPLELYARALIVSKNYARARDALRRALSLAPDSEVIKSQVVAVEYQASGLDAALSVARSFTTSDPQDPVGEILAAQVLAENGKIDEGIKLLEKARTEKASPKVVAVLSALYLSKNERDQAIAVLKEWLSKHPYDVAIRLRLAEDYLIKRDYDDARGEFEHLAGERGSDPAVLNNLAWLYQRIGDPRAREFAEKAYRLAPSPAVADTLGWVLTMQGGADTGLKYLKDASTAMPENPDIQYHLAVALRETGKVDDAREILRKIVVLKDEFESKGDAKRLLSQLGG